MNRGQKIIVNVTGIFLVLLLLVGLTYTYFLTRINGNTYDKSISVSTANLALVYGDGNGELTSDREYKLIGVEPRNYTIEIYSSDGTKLTKIKDNTEMYVATLTADEMSFAGATGVTNYTHYLMNEYAKNNDLY